MEATDCSPFRLHFAHHATREWIRNEAAYAAVSFASDVAGPISS